MTLIIAVLATGLLQGAQDPGELRDKIDRLRKRLPELDEKIRRAVEEERFDDAKRHTLDYQETELEIAQAKEKLEQVKAKEGPRLEWYKNFNIEGQGRHTWWDNELELEDGVGWGVEASFRGFLTFEYRRWETDDELLRGDAQIQAYMVGYTEEFSLTPSRRAAFKITGSAGWIDFDSDAAGGDDDLGLMLTIRPEWKYYLSEGLRLNAGGDIDILRTDFNQRHHHTRYDFSILLSIELAF